MFDGFCTCIQRNQLAGLSSINKVSDTLQRTILLREIQRGSCARDESRWIVRDNYF